MSIVAYATIDITGTSRRRAGRRADRYRLLVPRRFGHGRRRTRRPAARHEARRDSRVRGRCCPSASASVAGRRGDFRVIVKEAKQKVLPELTDEWVEEASEFETVDELRADIRKRLETMQKLQAQMAVRDRVLEAAADLVPVAAPGRSSTARRAVGSRTSRTVCNTRARTWSNTSRRPARTRRRSSTRSRRRGTGGSRRSRAARGRRAGRDRGDRGGDRHGDRSHRRTAGQKPEKVRRELERGGGSGDGTI